MEITVELPDRNSGSAKIKSQFLVQDHVRELDLNFVAAKDQNKITDERNIQSSEPPRKKLKGQNKHRPREKRAPKSEKLCFKIGTEGSCPFGESCCYSHDVKSYLEKKPPDIGPSCYLFETFGKCPYSFSCRFGTQHLKDYKNEILEEVLERCKEKIFYTNVLTKELQKSLRQRNYNFCKSDEVLKEFNSTIGKKDDINIHNTQVSESISLERSTENSQVDDEVVLNSANDEKLKKTQSDENLSQSSNFDLNNKHNDKIKVLEDVTPLEHDIKKIDFQNKLYLAPLTTVGNLPFRRICKEFGADITCSEMCVALSLLQGQQSEWALLKRHYTEDIFGIQLCGAHPDVMTRCSQLLSETVSFDFIDLNLGCPLDAIYKKGAGCGLMNRLKKLEGIVYGVSSVINVPLTLKMRKGIYGNCNIAHNVVQKIQTWKKSVSLITIHGRSREQRYTKSADWDYIHTFCESAKPIPVLGNGDILSYEDYNLRIKESGLHGAMIARGALIKPWIFKEIKEQTHWDISSSERFDILKKYTNYGLEHWGSDTEGVEKTRRFLLEWLSFLHRYIPVGVLEQVPQHINERPPAYIGRDDLETLMASPSCRDWVKISEMLLGPVPEHFVFLPKHKANAYK
ncbi:tRNA-dihydrouridine(47) synthase [NAD(P)(+)]-like [Uloborus diversus]|uniref:tRNA-dihydrouridine(47) synthase [NAD(P)(+)]-like n=1 Tax=Uloborus diversus TaxID=327109 RepID=UPI002409BD19|nr:tRNA-dihydrouridine(47) synthase [NAD(P)(+)]-like [Uloborus diversus]